MSITFSGLATGLDTNSIVSDLMAVERAPIDRITAKKDSETQKLAAYAQFNTKLTNLKSIIGDMSLTSQVRSTSVSLSSEDAFTAKTTSGAIGSYNVTVAQLSQLQKTVTDGFSSKTSAVLGTGSISVNGTEISVTEDNNSLAGLVAAINEKSDITGVQATIINDGSKDKPYHIIFTGKDSSTSFDVTTSLVGGEAEGEDVAIDPLQKAQQAVVFIDGIKVVSDTNVISDAISGVTLNLNSVSKTSNTGSATAEELAAGTPSWEWVDKPVYSITRLDVKADTGTLKEKITGFVTAYNEIMDWINSGYEEFGGSAEIPKTDGTDEEEAVLGSVLRGNASINSVKRQLQGILTSSVNNNGQFKILSEIGIGTDTDGTLVQNNTKLDTALKDNFDNVVTLLVGDDAAAGVMKNFNSKLLTLTSSTQGLYAQQKTSYTSKVNSYDTQLDQMELRMTKREASMRAQFTAMEQLVSLLNAQGDFLTQQMDALTGKNN